MLLSMTGFGAASVADDETSVSVEIKTVNNRYFKLSLRISDGYAPLESKIESRIRTSIDRGTANLSVRIRRKKKAEYRIATSVLQSYYEQLVDLSGELGHLGDIPTPKLDRLLTLPGVVETDSELSDENTEAVWKVVEQAIGEALENLQAMRKAEGDSMATDLTANVEQLRTMVGNVEQLAPLVAEQYRRRLTEKVERIMKENGVTLNHADLIREVAVFADRCDVSEETVRFRSHLAQIDESMKSRESCGRKLDFLTQELFRETNTIGSKANDAEITKQVVEMKTVIERIREMVQNVE